MQLLHPIAPILIADAAFMPLPNQIACLVLTALFFFSFSVAREPRGWRRLFQSMFATSADFSVNKNKIIDENLKKYGIVIAMVILVADVSIFVWGVTARNRNALERMSAADRMRLMDVQKVQGTQGAAGASKAVSN
jgi:predicted anti-sigma-YlaC factor YlaD